MCTVHLEETEIVLQSSERGEKGGGSVFQKCAYLRGGRGWQRRVRGERGSEVQVVRYIVFYLMRCAAGSRRYSILARHIIAIRGERES